MVVVVTALITDSDGRHLLQQRGFGSDFPGKWEHPGGKVEPGEHDHAALERELYEELRLEMMDVDQEPMARVRFFPPVVSTDAEIRFYRATVQGLPSIQEDQQAVVWAPLDYADSLDLIPGSRFIVDRLIALESRHAAD